MPKAAKGHDCIACDRKNSASNMVQCDKCNGWSHFDCANVSWSVKNKKWTCEKCKAAEKVNEYHVEGESKMVPGSKPQASCDLVHQEETKAAHGDGDQEPTKKSIHTEQQEVAVRESEQRAPERGSRHTVSEMSRSSSYWK